MEEIKIAEPLDLISIAMHNFLSARTDEKFYKIVKDWNKTIIIYIQPFYPVAVIFRGDQILFDLNIPKKFDLRVTMHLDTMMDLAYKRKGPIMLVLKRKLKVKGIYKIGLLLKFMNVFLKSMKMVGSNPNTNYFEIEKQTR